MSGSRSVVVGVLAVVGTLLGASPAVASRPADGTPRAPGLHWSGCGDGFQCATLRVPVDRTQPAGPTLGLAVTRRPAGRPSERVGVLLLNPGGPGEPAVAFLQDVAGSLPAAIRQRFDLVAFDPRGVGTSNPVVCEDSLDPLFDQAFSPADAAQRAALLRAAQAVADRCRTRNGGLLAHVSTADTAADMDAVRAALGQRSISFVGSSYGTLLGALYADRFPERVRAMVLDGPVDPALGAAASTLAQAEGFERALDDFLGDCSRRASCAFHHGGRAAAAYDALRARVGTRPIPSPTARGRALNQTRFDAAVLQDLYGGRALWPSLARALASAEHGDPSTLLEVADRYEGRAADGGDDHALDSFWAISCLDGPAVGDPTGFAELERRAAGVAPRLGPFVVNNSLPCAVWPVPANPPTGALHAVGAPPSLVVATTRDPATPLAQGRSLAAMLRAGLLVADGEQHTAFANGNRCVDAYVTRYLLTRRLPPRGAHCASS